MTTKNETRDERIILTNFKLFGGVDFNRVEIRNVKALSDFATKQFEEACQCF